MYIVQWNPVYTDTEGGFVLVSVLSRLLEKKNKKKKKTPATHFYRSTNQTKKFYSIFHLYQNLNKFILKKPYDHLS